MKLLFTVDDVENCKQEPSPEIDVLRIIMSEKTIRKTMEDFRIGLLSIKDKKDGWVDFGFHGKLTPPMKKTLIHLFR